MANNSSLWTALAFAGMAAIGATIVPALTGKATEKATRQKLKTSSSKIDFDNMGPGIVRKDHTNGEDDTWN